MAKYEVWVSFSGGAYYTVEADSENEAREKAGDYADIYDCGEWSYYAEECTKVNDNDN